MGTVEVVGEWHDLIPWISLVISDSLAVPATISEEEGNKNMSLSAPAAPRFGMEKLIPCRFNYGSGVTEPVNFALPVTVSQYQFRRVWAHFLRRGVKPKSSPFGYTLIDAEEFNFNTGHMHDMTATTKEAFLHILLEIRTWDFDYDEIAVRTSSVNTLENGLGSSGVTKNSKTWPELVV